MSSSHATTGWSTYVVTSNGLHPRVWFHGDAATAGEQRRYTTEATSACTPEDEKVVLGDSLNGCEESRIPFVAGDRVNAAAEDELTPCAICVDRR